MSLKWIKSTLGKTPRGLRCFLGSNVFARLDRIHKHDGLFSFYSPMFALPKTLMCFLMSSRWNVSEISLSFLTPADKDLLRAWQAKWVVPRSCSICNSADGIFWSVSGCCLQQQWRYRRSSDLAAANKKLEFEISKRAILAGKYTLRPRYHTEPDSTRTLNASQIRQTPTRPHTSDVRVLLRETQLEMGLLIARDSSSAFFRKKKTVGLLLITHVSHKRIQYLLHFPKSVVLLESKSALYLKKKP